MQIDPRHLEQLAAIVDAGTLQQAAAKIGTSQPALSRMIRSLEARIGMALFERSTRPLSATAIGLELAHQGRVIRNAGQSAAEIVDLGAKGFLGVLKIGAPPFLCRSLMSEAIAGFVAARPRVRVDLIPDYRAGLIERLYQNQIDVIVGPSKFIASNRSDFDILLIFRDVLAVVGRVDHPIMQLPAPGARDLEGAAWVGLPERSNLRTDMDSALEQFGVHNRRVVFQSESAGAVLEVLRETEFLTILPSYAVRPDGRDGLAIANLSLPNVDQKVGVIALANRPETRLVADFKEHLRRNVAPHYNRVVPGAPSLQVS